MIMILNVSLSSDSKLNSNMFKLSSLKELMKTVLLIDITVYENFTMIKVLFKVIN